MSNEEHSKFDLVEYRAREFQDLKQAFLGIGRKMWSVDDFREQMNRGEVQDLINYRKADPVNTGITLADDYQRAMDELEMTLEERKRIARYFLTERIRPETVKGSGWEETVDMLIKILELN